MPVNRMNRDEFYAAMMPLDDERLRKALWTVCWRGTAQVRERIEEELRPQGRPSCWTGSWPAVALAARS
jgi:hypothetical protein